MYLQGKEKAEIHINIKDGKAISIIRYRFFYAKIIIRILDWRKLEIGREDLYGN